MDLFNWGCRKRAISGFAFSFWRQKPLTANSLLQVLPLKEKLAMFSSKKGRTDVTRARSVRRDIEHQSCAHSAAVGFAINSPNTGKLPSTWADSVGKWQGSVCLSALCQLAHKWQNKKGRLGWEGASLVWKGMGNMLRFSLTAAGCFSFTPQPWKEGGQKRNGKKWRVSRSGGMVEEKTMMAHDFHQKRVKLMVCQCWYREAGQPVIEWFHNSLKQRCIGVELWIAHKIIDILTKMLCVLHREDQNHFRQMWRFV